MWPGPALASPGTLACELKAAAALQAALKLQGGLASQIPVKAGRTEFMRLLRRLQAMC